MNDFESKIEKIIYVNAEMIIVYAVAIIPNIGKKNKFPIILITKENIIHPTIAKVLSSISNGLWRTNANCHKNPPKNIGIIIFFIELSSWGIIVWIKEKMESLKINNGISIKIQIEIWIKFFGYRNCNM